MSYLGLVPSEHSTGEHRRRGQITKSGSTLARWLLIEAAWHHRHPPRRAKLARRQEGQPASVIALSWRTQQRLYQLWRRLDQKRGKRRQLVAVAIARDLAGFCWAIVNTD
jgi:transposase